MRFPPFFRLRVAVGAAAFLFAAARAESVARAETLVCAGSSEEGQRQRADGKLVVARDLFSKCATADCPALIRADCTQWLSEVNAEIPSIVLAIHDGTGKDVMGSVEIDGTSSRIPDGQAIVIDPGPHIFRVELDGKYFESKVIVNQGEKNKLVVVTVEHVESDVTKKKRTEVVLASRPIYPYIIEGAGLITVAIGVAFQLSALSEQSTSDASTASATAEQKTPACQGAAPPQATCPATYARISAHQSAVSDQTVAIPLFGVGAGLMIAGVITFLASTPSPVAKSGLRIVPSVNGQGGSMLLMGSF